MILKLCWNDINGMTYELGRLYKKEEYHFDINSDGLKQATHKGCFGIGEFDLLHDSYVNTELFEFFKRRIPKKDNPDIEKILQEFDIKQYDEMELLKITQGKLISDRYYLEEVLE